MKPNIITMEDIIPIVAKLTEKYTSKESTSVTYDKARDLIGAVIYCIKASESGRNGSLPVCDKPSAEELYETGYRIVVDRVMRTNAMYNRLLDSFDAYENVFLHDTVIKGLPEFFLRYDAKFAPQEHLLTLDYPILRKYDKLRGINLIEKYIYCISLEQLYLNSFTGNEVIELLDEYDFDYRECVVNVASLVMRRQLRRDCPEAVRECTKSCITKSLWLCLKSMGIAKKEVFDYLVNDIDDAIVEFSI